MKLLKILYILLINLPRILDMIDERKKQREDEATEKKIEEDFNEIDQAFKDRDPERLRRVFNS